jgi:hypothetical protein
MSNFEVDSIFGNCRPRVVPRLCCNMPPGATGSTSGSKVVITVTECPAVLVSFRL